MGFKDFSLKLERNYNFKDFECLGGVRSGSVRGAYEVRSGSVRDQFGVCSGSVRGPFGVRSESVRNPFGPRNEKRQSTIGANLPREAVVSVLQQGFVATCWIQVDRLILH